MVDNAATRRHHGERANASVYEQFHGRLSKNEHCEVGLDWKDVRVWTILFDLLCATSYRASFARTDCRRKLDACAAAIS